MSNNIDIHYVLQNIDDFKATDIFQARTVAGVGSRSEQISIYLAEKVYELFDNLSVQSKIEVIRDLIKQHVDIDGFEFEGTKLQDLTFDTLLATEAYFTSNFDEYAHAPDFCRDFEINLYLHDLYLND